ncbi:MAG: hypothetical protein KatS3mg026_1091 [Bacteroidia bacterium]|nr:MAG: hypothetical protein KatS3mg026_1091 [Bacteroidia bacterium]
MVSVTDAVTSTVIAPVGGYYPIGTLAKGTDRYFYVRAQLAGCTPPDTLWARVGWDCAGYPPSLATYACVNSAPRDTLTYLLGTPALTIGSTVSPNPSELCDSLEVTVTVTNAGSAYAYQPRLYFILPTGVVYVAGSAEANTGSGWYPIADPSVFFGVLRFWDLAGVVPAWSGGMPHTGTNQVQIRFRVTHHLQLHKWRTNTLLRPLAQPV